MGLFVLFSPSLQHSPFTSVEQGTRIVVWRRRPCVERRGARGPAASGTPHWTFPGAASHSTGLNTAAAWRQVRDRRRDRRDGRREGGTEACPLHRRRRDRRDWTTGSIKEGGGVKGPLHTKITQSISLNRGDSGIIICSIKDQTNWNRSERTENLDLTEFSSFQWKISNKIIFKKATEILMSVKWAKLSLFKKLIF